MAVKTTNKNTEKQAKQLRNDLNENWDGTGGPEKLKGESIPFMARILSVSDAFDAMTSDRPYRKKMSIDTAVKEIAANSGKQFDPEIVKIFLKIKDSLLPQAFYD